MSYGLMTYATQAAVIRTLPDDVVWLSTRGNRSEPTGCFVRFWSPSTGRHWELHAGPDHEGWTVREVS